MIIVYQICDYQKTYNIDKYSKNSMFHDKSELVYIKRHLQLFMLIERMKLQRNLCKGGCCDDCNVVFQRINTLVALHVT